MTGHPRVDLTLASSHTDGSVFAYLVDVAPDGRTTIVTEGMLRLSHRRFVPGTSVLTTREHTRQHAEPLVPGEPARAVFDLLPVSYRFPAGHSVRLALTGADADHFRAVTSDAPCVDWLWGDAWRSRLELPVASGQAR